MSKRFLLIAVVLVLGSTTGVVNADITAELLVHWTFDEGSGTIVADASGNGHDGEFNGEPQWVEGHDNPGALHFDGVDDYVLHSLPGDQAYDAFTVAVWVKADSLDQAEQSGVFSGHMPGGATGAGFQIEARSQDGTLGYFVHPPAYAGRFGDVITDWVHIALVGEVTAMQLYYQGAPVATTTIASDLFNVFAVGSNRGISRWFAGTIDELRVYSRALTADDIVELYEWKPSAAKASDPSPGDTAVDVPRDTVLTWSAGEFAAEHDVYLGTAFDDVNDAATTDTAYQGRHEQTSFDPGFLTLGESYFWRIDEVNAAPDNTVFKGETWSFTVEPVSYAIPIGAVSAMASSMVDPQDPNNTVNGSGLDPNTGEHSNLIQDMWISAMDDAEPSIQFEFEKLQKLDKVLVWNHNSQSEAILGFGTKEALITYSVDGETWSELGTVEIAQAPGMGSYTGVEVRLEGIVAQLVKLTCLSNWSALPSVTQKGLSEVRFFAVPVYASEPQPEDGVATDGADITLQWRAGREAVTHEVLLSSDPNAVLDGSAVIGTTQENTYTPDPLDYDTTYTWRIREVNEAETPASYDSELWSFNTPAYAVVDDFEKYADKEGLWIWSFWADGFENPDNGSVVGYGNIGERTIVHGGSQSMPIQFSNTSAATSEVTLQIDNEDWGASGIQSLSLFIYGDPDNTGELYLKINDTRIDYEGLPDALQRTQWIPWNIDLTLTAVDLTHVTSLTVGIGRAGASGKIYVDDIRLYPLAPATIEPILPDDGDPNLVVHYEFEGNANDSRGNYPGTAEGDPLYTDGKIGQAILLDNIDDHIVNAFDQDVIWPAYTVSLWVKTDLFNQVINSGLFNNNSASSDFQIEVNGSDSYLYRGAATGVFGAVSSDWVHLTVSCDGVQTDLYYNGLQVGTVNVADTNFGQIAVGINRGMNNWFGGTIDDVQVYDRALSNAEAAGLAGMTDTVPVPF